MYDAAAIYKNFRNLAKCLLSIDNENFKRELFILAYRKYKSKIHPYDHIYQNRMTNFKKHFFRKLKE